MAVLSRSYGYLFIQAPRTGTTSVERGVLGPHLEGERFPSEHVYDAAGRIRIHSKHATLEELIRGGLLSREEVAGLFTFSAVRNPFDSEVSRYLKFRGRYAARLGDAGWERRNPEFAADVRAAQVRSFPDWLEWMYGGPTVPRWLWRRRLRSRRPRIGAHQEGVDLVMRFERLQEDFQRVLDRLGVARRFELPQLNPTTERTNRAYREHYDDRARAIVAEVYRDQIRRFGYEF